MTFGDFRNSSPLSLALETFLLITQLLHAHLGAGAGDHSFYVTMFRKGRTKTYTLSFNKSDLPIDNYNAKLRQVAECEQELTGGKKTWSYAYGVQYYEAYANGNVTVMSEQVAAADFEGTFTYDNTTKILQLLGLNEDDDDKCQLRGTLKGLNQISLLPYPLPTFIANSFERYSIPHLLRLHKEAEIDTTLLEQHAEPVAFDLHAESADPFYWKFTREPPPDDADANEVGKYKVPQKAKQVLMKRFDERREMYDRNGGSFKVNVYQVIPWERIHGINQLQSDPFRLLTAMLKRFNTLRSETATDIEMVLMRDEFRRYRELIATHQHQVQACLIAYLQDREISDADLAARMSRVTVTPMRIPANVQLIRQSYEHQVKEKRLEVCLTFIFYFLFFTPFRSSNV